MQTWIRLTIRHAGWLTWLFPHSLVPPPLVQYIIIETNVERVGLFGVEVVKRERECTGNRRRDTVRDGRTVIVVARVVRRVDRSVRCCEMSELFKTRHNFHSNRLFISDFIFQHNSCTSLYNDNTDVDLFQYFHESRRLEWLFLSLTTSYRHGNVISIWRHVRSIPNFMRLIVLLCDKVWDWRWP